MVNAAHYLRNRFMPNRTGGFSSGGFCDCQLAADQPAFWTVRKPRWTRQLDGRDNTPTAPGAQILDNDLYLARHATSMLDADTVLADRTAPPDASACSGCLTPSIPGMAMPNLPQPLLPSHHANQPPYQTEPYLWRLPDISAACHTWTQPR